MSLANKLTFLRIILAPVFFVIYFLPNILPLWYSQEKNWTVPALVILLWLIFISSQVTDLLDGIAARKRNETSDFGKFFDPFADTFMQITCFLCYVIDGIFPAFLFLIVLYREFGILFLRNIMLKNGITMGARMSGKVKTVTYIIAGGFALLAISIQRLDLFTTLFPYIKITALVIFIISIIFSIISFVDYLLVYKKTISKILESTTPS